MTATTLYRERVLAEIDSLPDEYLPFVLQLVHTLRKSVTLKPAAASLRQGWAEAQQGVTYPIDELWEDIDAE
ncbi:MAG: hypothetical protein ABIV47_00530 [Roseiflexaceae bacterium]